MSLSRRMLVLALALTWPLVSAAQERLTVDRAFGQTLRAAARVPETAWLDDGSVLLWDPRAPASERTLERFDPASGQRHAAVNRGQALTSLARLLESDTEEPPEVLEWPDAIHEGGRRALYLIHDDVFLLDLGESRFTRLTRTAEAEKNPSLAPDGATAAWVRDNNLFVMNLERGVERALTDDGSEALLNATLSWVYWEEIFNREDAAYWWTPDSSAIAFLQSDESEVSVSVFPDFEPATPRVTRQRYPKAGSTNPVVRLGVVSLGSQPVTWIDLGSPRPEYIVRVDWLDDGRHLAVQTLDRPQQRLDLHLVDVAAGTRRVLLTETSTTWVSIHDNLEFLEAGRSFLWTSEREGYSRLYLYDIDGSLRRTLSPPDLSVRSVDGVDEGRGWVYYTAVSGHPLTPTPLRTRLDGSATVPLIRDRGSHRVELDPTSTLLLDRASDASTPPALHLRRGDGSLVATLAAPASEAFGPYDLQTPEFLTVTTADGAVLPVQMQRPRDFDPARRYPVILFVYGGPNAPTVRNAWQRSTLFNNILLDHGYICVGADNRSASGVSKTLAETSYRRIYSASEVADISAVVDWLHAQPWVDPERIGVWGWSGGGTFTLQLMTHSTAFAAGIAVAPVTDLRYYDTVWTEAFMGTPENNADGYAAGSPATAAAQLSGRLLLVHGTHDDNVHPQNSWRFAHELIEAGITYDMMIYPMEKHGIRGARSHVFATMLEFWKRNL